MIATQQTQKLGTQFMGPINHNKLLLFTVGQSRWHKSAAPCFLHRVTRVHITTPQYSSSPGTTIAMGRQVELVFSRESGRTSIFLGYASMTQSIAKQWCPSAVTVCRTATRLTTAHHSTLGFSAQLHTLTLPNASFWPAHRNCMILLINSFTLISSSDISKMSPG